MRTLVCFVGSIGFHLGAAAAQPAPTFQKGDPAEVAEVEDVEWTATGGLGLIATTGNSQTTTITASGNATRKDADNKFDAALAAAFARASTRTASDLDGSGAIEADELSSTNATSAKNIALKLRYDRYLTAHDALYIAALGAIDQPAGKDFQGGAQFGYSRGLYVDDKHELLAEAGYDLSFLELSVGSSSTIHSLRLFTGYKGKLTSTTSLEASLEALLNANSVAFGGRDASRFEATRLNGLVGATTSLSSKLSLSASFGVRYDNFPAPLAAIGPVPFAVGFEPAADKVDTITKLSLIVTFL
jgi:hypothetical protein